MNPFDEVDNGPINPFDKDTTPKSEHINGMTKTGSLLVTGDIHSHWQELHGIITTGITDPFDVVDVKKHLNAMGKLVAEETPQSTGRTGNCLEHLLSEDVIEQIYTLSLRERNYAKDLLYQICVIIHDNPSLLDLFFMDGRKSSQSKCLVFALLISHIHETSNRVLTGDVYGSCQSVASCSRDAVLLFLSLAKKIDHKGVASFITNDTSFCPVS